jgi:transposase
VRRWRDRFLDGGRIAALRDKPRSGRPISIDCVTRCEVIGIACGKPKDFGVETRDVWTYEAIRKVLLARNDDAEMSRTTVIRILNQADIRPHRIKMWCHSPDPDFREKVTDICGLYRNPPPGSIVLCVDEKTGMQALGRKHPDRPLLPGQDARQDYEYIRNGTRKLLAVFDPHTGEVYGHVRATRAAADLLELMEEVAKRHPGVQVHVVWDNLNIHHDGPGRRWSKFNQRHGGRFHFHYTPLHASWVNQIEIFFGILHRRVLRHGVFNSLEELDRAIYAFIEHWNRREAHPFRWTFKGYPLQRAAKAA